jgi:hypothetical protein
VTAFRLAARDFRSTAAVGARLRAMLLLGRVQGLQSKSFRLPSAAESLSLCVAKEKVTQEKGHPDGAPCGHPALRVRGWATGFFDSTSCAGEKLAGILAGHPAGFPSPTRRAIGAPGRAARSRRALFRRAEARAKPDQEQSNIRAMLRCCYCSSAFRRVRAAMARCSTRGPLCGGESGTTGRAAGVDKDVDSFSHGQDARSKSPAPAHGLAGQEARQAPSGVAFLFGYLSLWPRKEKVTRAP